MRIVANSPILLLLARWLPLVPPLELNAGDGSLLRVGLKQSSLKFLYSIDDDELYLVAITTM